MHWIARPKPDGTTEYVRDTGNIRRCELRIKARRWLLSKLLPKIFGDRPDPKSDLAELMKQIEERNRALRNG